MSKFTDVVTNLKSDVGAFQVAHPYAFKVICIGLAAFVLGVVVRSLL